MRLTLVRPIEEGPAEAMADRNGQTMDGEGQLNSGPFDRC